MFSIVPQGSSAGNTYLKKWVKRNQFEHPKIKKMSETKKIRTLDFFCFAKTLQGGKSLAGLGVWGRQQGAEPPFAKWKAKRVEAPTGGEHFWLFTIGRSGVKGR